MTRLGDFPVLLTGTIPLSCLRSSASSWFSLTTSAVGRIRPLAKMDTNDTNYRQNHGCHGWDTDVWNDERIACPPCAGRASCFERIASRPLQRCPRRNDLYRWAIALDSPGRDNSLWLQHDDALPAWDQRRGATTAESPAKRAAPQCWPQIGCPATRSFRGREKTHCENARVSVARGYVASAFHSGKDLISIYAVRDRKKAYG